MMLITGIYLLTFVTLPGLFLREKSLAAQHLNLSRISHTTSIAGESTIAGLRGGSGKGRADNYSLHRCGKRTQYNQHPESYYTYISHTMAQHPASEYEY